MQLAFPAEIFLPVTLAAFRTTLYTSKAKKPAKAKARSLPEKIEALY